MRKRVFLPALLILTLSAGLLTAQNLDEDQLLLKQYKLPAEAIADSLLTEIDSVMYKDGSLFTGTGYSVFANGQLQHATPYVNGLKHGTAYVWYPDGKPMLLANYRNNHLNGRFKGWYQFGAVIYDLVMRDSSLAGDQMYDSDVARETGSGDDSEPSADARGQEND